EKDLNVEPVRPIGRYLPPRMLVHREANFGVTDLIYPRTCFSEDLDLFVNEDVKATYSRSFRFSRGRDLGADLTFPKAVMPSVYEVEHSDTPVLTLPFDPPVKQAIDIVKYAQNVNDQEFPDRLPMHVPLGAQPVIESYAV